MNEKNFFSNVLENASLFLASTFSCEMLNLIKLCEFPKEFNEVSFISEFNHKLCLYFNDLVSPDKVPFLQNGCRYALINAFIIQTLKDLLFYENKALLEQLLDFFMRADATKHEITSGYIAFAICSDNKDMLYYPLVQIINDKGEQEIWNILSDSKLLIHDFLLRYYPSQIDNILIHFEKYVNTNPLSDLNDR